MLADLPLELVDHIAHFLSYSDLVSLKVTCKSLASQVEFVEFRVRRLNVFIGALPYETDCSTWMSPPVTANRSQQAPPKCCRPNFEIESGV